MTTVHLLLTLPTLLLAPQDRPADEGTFAISRGGVTIGTEHFSVRRGRTSIGADGIIVATTASYPADGRAADAPRVSLAPIVELGIDSLPTAVQFDVADDAPRRLYARFASRRVTVRAVSASGESAREYPAPARALVADDSVFALYAVLPGRQAGPLVLFHVRTGRRVPATVTSRGIEPTALGGAAPRLEHLVLEADGEARHLWYDAAGRLMKVEIPSLGLTAARSEPVPRR